MSIKGDVRWGIIGCGDVCEVKSGPAFNKVPHSTLDAVMRRDLVKAEDYAKRHNVPHFFSDAGAIINNKDIDAVYIATPPSSHEEYAIASMKAGKAVYIEKPVTVNTTSCERMIQVASELKSLVTVAHYRRELPLFRKVRELIEADTIGRVRLVSLRMLQSPVENIITKTEDNWRVNPALSGGGLFHDLAPHQLDIMIWLFGEPTKILGNSVNQAKEYDAPDVTTLDVVFNKDIVFQGLWSFNVPRNEVEDTCRIIGEKGSLTFSFFRNPVLTLVTDDEEKVMDLTVPPHIQQPMIEQVVNYFRGEAANPCSLQQALISLKMMDSTIR